MAVRLLFREKSSENRCGERSVERTHDDRIRWEWHSHQNSTVASVRICTPNWGTSPKMYAIKRLPHSLACISTFSVNYVFLLQFIEYIRYIKKGLIPGSERSPGKGNDNPLLPGEFHGQRSLVGYCPWGCKELDTTEWLTWQHKIYI